MTTPTTFPTRRQSGTGFTIIELLIAVIIIGILVAIIVPVLVNRAADARIAAVKSDLDAIQTAEQHAGIDTGYFYRLYVLDDVRGGDNVAADNPADVVDGIRDEGTRSDAGSAGGSNIFIDTEAGTFLNASTASDKFKTLSANETNFNWNGPYLNYSRKTTLTDPADMRPVGLPVDPYGKPYLLFTREGLVREPDGVIEANTYLGQPTKIFDRPTVVSLGPNNAPGDGTGTGANAGFGKGDDILRQF